MTNLPRLELIEKDGNNEYIIFRNQVKSKTIKNNKKNTKKRGTRKKKKKHNKRFFNIFYTFGHFKR